MRFYSSVTFPASPLTLSLLMLGLTLRESVIPEKIIWVYDTNRRRLEKKVQAIFFLVLLSFLPLYTGVILRDGLKKCY